MKKIYFILKISLSAITKNAVRSFLSVLGIAIGIAAVIAMLGLGNGAQTSIQNSIQKLGSNTITISNVSSRQGPGGGLPSTNGPSAQSTTATASVPLSEDDYNFFSQNLPSQNDNIDKVAGSLSDSGQLELSDKTLVNASISGVTADYFQTQGLSLAFGSANLTSSANIVLGNSLADQIKQDKKLNDQKDLINSKVIINQKEFNIIGVLNKTDSVLSSASNSSIFESTDYYFQQNPTKKFFSQIIISVKDSNKLSDTKSVVENKFREFRGLKSDQESNFSISTTADLASSVSQITGIITTLLAGISGISLLVGGIGISNIMLVSVTERTREIGLRKAIGAKRKYILWQFLVEAIMLTLIGGILGVASGYLLSSVVGSLIDLEVTIKLENILLATGVSSLIGIFFGFVPAWNASRLSPVEALRYE